MGFLMPTPPPMPKPPAPPSVPMIDNARQRMQDSDVLGKRRGRSADVMTGAGGDLTKAPIGTRELLGG